MAKGENVAFEVGVSSIRERLGNQVYSAGRLFASGVLMDEILSQGFDYTPTKSCFRPMFSLYSGGKIGEMSTRDALWSWLPSGEIDDESLGCYVAPRLNSCILVGKRRLSFG